MEVNYNEVLKKYGLKLYVFLTEAGYRSFLTYGKDLKDAEENFMKWNIFQRHGFSIEDLPVRLEYNKEKMKHWSMDDFSDNNEAKKATRIYDNN